MAVVTGDRYLESLVTFVDKNAGALIEGSLVLKVNPVGLHYVQSRLEALNELERLISGAPVDYLRSYIADLGDHRALEQLRRILCRLTSVKVVSVLPLPARDPTPLSLLPFGRLKVLELRGCDLSTSAAKGLLELRHTLEKLICHNSTDALRHVFASRIAEIKDSHQWNRLSFVSCASNGLLLMDESLQLLPAVETLDLSRNKFAKVDNLQKCTKLAHLDLGFNQLRSVAPFGEFSCHILKLVLRNNALTTIRGVDNLRSLEGLDLSYNIISNFSELEVLSRLPSLQKLWLEGNPLSCARWYRPQVFSFFPFPDKLKLDDEGISTKEFWKRQIIIARRQKRPASYGFYSPVREGAEEGGHANMKKKKFSRLACIENEELSAYSDHESVSCDNEIHGGNENIISDDETEIVGLMNRIEFMKKERSILWLRDFKKWMDEGFENVVDGSRSTVAVLGPYRGNYLKASHRDIGVSSRYTSDSVHATGGDSGTNILESDSSFADFLAGFHAHQFVDTLAETASPFYLGATLGESEIGPVSEDAEHLNRHLLSRSIYQSLTDYNSDTDVFATKGGDRICTSATPLTVISDIMESQSSSACHGSPPHYQEDILHRRHYLEEEFLQLSAGSFSVAASDSNTSSSEDEKCRFVPVFAHIEKKLGEEVVDMDIDGHSSYLFVERNNGTHEFPEARQNGQCCSDLQAEQTSFREMHGDDVATTFKDGEMAVHAQDELDRLEEQRKKKPKRRVVSLFEENDMSCKNDLNSLEPLQRTVGNPGSFTDDMEDVGKKLVSDGGHFGDNVQLEMHTKDTSTNQDETSGVLAGVKHSDSTVNDCENYFNSLIADSGVHETCIQCIICSSFYEQGSQQLESEVIVLLSSEHKLYVLQRNLFFDGSGNDAYLVTSHKIEDVTEVLVGLGLQVVRVRIDADAVYLLITKSAEKSRHLLWMLEDCGSHGANNKFWLRSLEQVQIDLFYEHICGGSETGIYQYGMVLFSQNDGEEGQWASRSLFVSGGLLFVCIEDILQFSSLSSDAAASNYYLLDSSCSIADVNEMMIEAGECQCVTLTLESEQNETCLSAIGSISKFNTGFNRSKRAEKFRTWKLKWATEESLFKFVALVKAMHVGLAISNLSITFVS